MISSPLLIARLIDLAVIAGSITIIVLFSFLVGLYALNAGMGYGS